VPRAPCESEKTTFKAGTAKYATVAFPDLAVKSVKATLNTLDCGGSASGGGLPVRGCGRQHCRGRGGPTNRRRRALLHRPPTPGDLHA
jgi:hypothetical protein